MFLFNWFIVVVGQVSDGNVTDQLYCLGQHGQFAHPTNCSRYAICIDGRLNAIQLCPPDRHWHVTKPGYGFCDLPESAGCKLAVVPDPVISDEPVKPQCVHSLVRSFIHFISRL